MNININAQNYSPVNSTRRMICNHDVLMIGSMLALSKKQNHMNGSSTPQQANRIDALIATRRKMKEMMLSLSENEEIHNYHTSSNILKSSNENTPSVLRMSMVGSTSATSTSSSSSVTLTTDSNDELSPLNVVSEDSDDDFSSSSSTMDFVRSLSNQQEEENLMEMVEEIVSLDEASIIPYRRMLG